MGGKAGRRGKKRRSDFDVGRLVLDDAGKTALRRYLDLGGNFVAIHSASDALRNTTWFIHEVGECTSRDAKAVDSGQREPSRAREWGAS